MLSRSARLLLLVFVCILVPSLYIFYPSPNSSEKNPHKPTDEYHDYEAGGIDSAHYRTPVKPNFELEEPRWDKSEADAEEEAVFRIDEDDQLCTDAGCTPGGTKGTAEAKAKGHSKQTTPLHDGHSGTESRVGSADLDRQDKPVVKGSGSREKAFTVNEVEATIGGGVIMPKLANETAKAELGRAAWRVLHLMTLRFPEKPTADDRAALKSYMHLFSRLYPCGECATEFQALLKQYPPQTSSRKSASMWLCHVHNMVNERLGKPEFDCLTLDEMYDCGCGDEPVAGTNDSAHAKSEKNAVHAPSKERIPSSPDTDTRGSHYDEDGPFDRARDIEADGRGRQEVASDLA